MPEMSAQFVFLKKASLMRGRWAYSGLVNCRHVNDFVSLSPVQGQELMFTTQSRPSRDCKADATGIPHVSMRAVRAVSCSGKQCE